MINEILQKFGYKLTPISNTKVSAVNSSIEVWNGISTNGTVITIRSQTGATQFRKNKDGFIKTSAWSDKQILLKSNITVKDLYNWYYLNNFHTDKVHNYWTFIIYPKNELTYKILDDQEIINKYKLVYFVFKGG